MRDLFKSLYASFPTFARYRVPRRIKRVPRHALVGTVADLEPKRSRRRTRRLRGRLKGELSRGAGRDPLDQVMELGTVTWYGEKNEDRLG